MQQTCSAPPADSGRRCGTSVPRALKMRPARRPYALLEFLRQSPEMRSDIGRGSPGIQLHLSIELRDALEQPVEHAAVYVWHSDPRALAVDVPGKRRASLPCIRGVQVSDAAGLVHFQTVYPTYDRDGSARVYLQIYCNTGHQVSACADACVILPRQAGGPLQGIPLCLPASARAQRPLFNGAGDAAVLMLRHLTLDADEGSLHGRLCINLAI